MKAGILGAVVLAVVSLSTMAVITQSESISLKFVQAETALTQIREQLGAEAAAAIRKVNMRENSLELHSGNAHEAAIRKLIAEIDRRPEQLHVSAVITRHFDAKPGAPARDVVVGKPAALVGVAQALKFTIPEGDGSTQIELKITPVASVR